MNDINFYISTDKDQWEIEAEVIDKDGQQVEVALIRFPRLQFHKVLDYMTHFESEWFNKEVLNAHPVN